MEALGYAIHTNRLCRAFPREALTHSGLVRFLDGPVCMNYTYDLVRSSTRYLPNPMASIEPEIQLPGYAFAFCDNLFRICLLWLSTQA